MIINKVEIENFKVFGNQTFDFTGARLVLLTGPNGFGKTTLLDAIEWCFTGKIGRLMSCYEERYTKKLERDRRENKAGIIKNSKCTTTDEVKVSITLEIEGEIVKVYRKQIQDDLYVHTELQFLGKLAEAKKNYIKKELEDDKFYKYHVCDTYKSYNFLNSNRQEVKDKFKEFIKEKEDLSEFLNKLKELDIYSQDKIQQLEGNLISMEVIEAKKNEITDLKKNGVSLEYPYISFYTNENLNIIQQSISEVEEQLKTIKICGYNEIYTLIDKVLSFYKRKNRKNKINELVIKLNTEEKVIREAIEKKYYDIKDKQLLLDEKKAFIQGKKQLNRAININDVLGINLLDIYPDEKFEVEKCQQSIKGYEEQLVGLDAQIADKEQGNDIISILSDIISKKQAVLKYKDEGNTLCPICGSDEKFKHISKEQDIAKSAEQYLNKSKSDLAELKNSAKEIRQIINQSIQELKQTLINKIEIHISEVEKSVTVFEEVYTDTKDFFDTCKKLDIPIDSKCVNAIELESNTLNILTVDDSEIEKDIQLIKNISILIEYNKEINTENIDNIEQNKLEIEGLYNPELIVNNFEFNAFRQKIICCESLINNNTISKCEKELSKYSNTNKLLEEQISKYNKYRRLIKETTDKISKINTKLEQEELAAVGPYLYKIFSKFIKHCKIESFTFKRDGAKGEGGATFVDNEGNNILNTLSQGQLSVFMLAYFVANMFKRNNETNFKIYFIDDITSCMDDINVLSFIEVIKYQLYSEESVMKQVFFSTCDNSLEKLFVHKMRSFNIKAVNCKFNCYGEKEDLIIGQ